MASKAPFEYIAINDDL